MADFKIIYYILVIIYVLLIAVFAWGWITYSRTKTKIKFFNEPLVTITSVSGVIGLILSFVPLFMKIWSYDSDYVKQDTVFIVLLVLEFIFLAIFLALAYVYAFDFGIAIDEKEEKVQFFGQTVNLNKIVEIQEKKYSLRIIYEQGFKNIKKKVIIFSPKAKAFVRENFVSIVNKNIENKNKKNVTLQEQKKLKAKSETATDN